MKVEVCVLHLDKIFNIAAKKTEKPENSVSVFQNNSHSNKKINICCVFFLSFF